MGISEQGSLKFGLEGTERWRKLKRVKILNKKPEEKGKGQVGDWERSLGAPHCSQEFCMDCYTTDILQRCRDFHHHMTSSGKMEKGGLYGAPGVLINAVTCLASKEYSWSPVCISGFDSCFLTSMHLDKIHSCFWGDGSSCLSVVENYLKNYEHNNFIRARQQSPFPPKEIKPINQHANNRRCN